MSKVNIFFVILNASRRESFFTRNRTNFIDIDQQLDGIGSNWPLWNRKFVIRPNRRYFIDRK